MANGRNRIHYKKGQSGRDAGGFIALPWAVIDCPAYARLSYPAKALLIEIARQFASDNNGSLLASAAYLRGRGWSSCDVIYRAKQELLNAGFIFETVKGHRPNRASWHALTWYLLDRRSDYDPGAVESFERSAYARSSPLKNASLNPSRGAKGKPIAPAGGSGEVSPAPSDGAIHTTSEPPPAPPPGDHLEEPSANSLQQGSYQRLTAGRKQLFTSLIH